MFRSKFRQAVTTTVAALAVLALAAPAAEARRPTVPPTDTIVQPIDPCICLPPTDLT